MIPCRLVFLKLLLFAWGALPCAMLSLPVVTVIVLFYVVTFLRLLRLDYSPYQARYFWSLCAFIFINPTCPLLSLLVPSCPLLSPLAPLRCWHQPGGCRRLAVLLAYALCRLRLYNSTVNRSLRSWSSTVK